MSERSTERQLASAGMWFAAAIRSTLREAGQGGWGAAHWARCAALLRECPPKFLYRIPLVPVCNDTKVLSTGRIRAPSS